MAGHFKHSLPATKSLETLADHVGVTEISSFYKTSLLEFVYWNIRMPAEQKLAITSVVEEESKSGLEIISGK